MMPSGKPFTPTQPLTERDLEERDWKRLSRRRLAEAWEGDEDALYDYL